MKRNTPTMPSTEYDSVNSETKPAKKKRLALPAGVRQIIGPKPIIRYGNLAALKIFEKLGFRFEVRHLGESKIGLLRWPLRKLSPAKTARRLIVTPGFGDTPLGWISVIASLKPILKREVDEVILMDFPGYSGFLHDESGFDSMDELTRCYIEVVESLKPEIIMGHSLGGWLATTYAVQNAKHGKNLKQLILVNPGGVMGTEEQKAEYCRLFKSAVQANPEQVIPHAFAKVPFWIPLFQEEFLGFLRTPEARAFVDSFGDQHVLDQRLSELRVKTTVIWGDRDTMTPTDWIHSWLRLLPKEAQGIGLLIKGAGHSPQIEKPGVLIALLTQVFLRREPRNFQILPLWKVIKPSVEDASA